MAIKTYLLPRTTGKDALGNQFVTIDDNNPLPVKQMSGTGGPVKTYMLPRTAGRDALGNSFVTIDDNNPLPVNLIGGGGGVSSVATDATLIGGPITTTGTLGINLSNPNIWTTVQRFPNVLIGQASRTNADALDITLPQDSAAGSSCIQGTASSGGGNSVIADQMNVSSVGATLMTSAQCYFANLVNLAAGGIAQAQGFVGGVSTQTGNIAIAYQFWATAPFLASGGTITTMVGLRIDAQKAAGVTNAYGIYQIGASDINYFAGSVGVGVTNPSSLLDVVLTDAGTATAPAVITVDHESSGTPTVGFGSQVLFVSKDSTTATQTQSAINSVWLVATHASRSSQIQFQTVSNAGALSTGLLVGSGISAATAGLIIGGWNTTTGGIWASTVTPTTSNYSFVCSSSTTVVNSPSGSTTVLAVNGATTLSVSATAVSLIKPILTYNNIATQGIGVPATYGLDNRTGLVAADGAPITLYTSTAANQLYKITVDIFATAAVTGTATYSITWTENSTAQTASVTATAINVQGTATQLIRPDNGTAIKAQLTFAGATGTFSVAGVVQQLA